MLCITFDPANRFVADTLEAEWNNKLRALNEAQQEYERLRQSDRIATDETQRVRLVAVASDFPRLWQDPKTSDRDKKRMVRLLLEDVTIRKHETISVYVRFKGGASARLSLPLPLSLGEFRKTDDAIIGEIDRLLDQHTEKEIATILSAKGMRSRDGKPLHRRIIARLARAHKLKDRFTRLREAGMLTMQEIAARAGITVGSVKDWCRRGLLHAHRYNDKGECLFVPPPSDLPRKSARKSAYLRQKEVSANVPEGVQYET